MYGYSLIWDGLELTLSGAHFVSSYKGPSDEGCVTYTPKFVYLERNASMLSTYIHTIPSHLSDWP